MIRKTMSLALATVATASVVMGCSKDPQLNLQPTAESRNAPQAAPAGTQTAASLPPAGQQPMSAPSGMPPGELPAGHPSVALPPGHPPAGNMGGMGAPGTSGIALPPVDPAAGLGTAALVWDVPKGWVNQPPANPMRRAQYRVPGAAGDGELVVFYFGPDQGGPPLDNAQRWGMQFTQPDGSDPMKALKTRVGDIGGIPALFVETTGTYNSGSMTGGPAVAKPNWALLGVVAQGGDANWFFKFTGPKPTIDAERKAFEGMIASLHHGK